MEEKTEFDITISYYKCLKCSSLYEYKQPNNEMQINFILFLKCDNCGELAHIFTLDDENFINTYNEVKEIFTKEKKDIDAIDIIKTNLFKKLFLQQCQSCECGGKYSFDNYNRCPNCGNTNNLLLNKQKKKLNIKYIKYK